LLGGTVHAGNPQLLRDETIDGGLPDGVSRTQSHRWQTIAGKYAQVE
jgi:hypothetical protein